MDVDEFHAQVYKLGGGVTTNENLAPHETLYAMVSLPGILTKYERLPDAVKRLEDHMRAKK